MTTQTTIPEKAMPVNAGTGVAQAQSNSDRAKRTDSPTSNVRKIHDIPFEKLIHLRLKPVIENFDDEHYMENFYHTIVEKVERPLIKLILEKTRGNQLKASAILGINRNTLRKKINKLNIKL